MEKHSHYQEQLELSHQKLLHVEALGDSEHIQKNKDKYNTLSEKTREMGYKVRGGRTRYTPRRLSVWVRAFSLPYLAGCCGRDGSTVAVLYDTGLNDERPAEALLCLCFVFFFR